MNPEEPMPVSPTSADDGDTTATAASIATETTTRDIADVPAVEVIGSSAVHLMSATAVNLGLAEDLPDHRDLGEARMLIEALAGLVTAATPVIGHHHAAPLRDGLKSLQLAFREAAEVPDAPGEGPGERMTGPVYG